MSALTRGINMEGEFFFYGKYFHETLELIMKIRTIKHLEKIKFMALE